MNALTIPRKVLATCFSLVLIIAFTPTVAFASVGSFAAKAKGGDVTGVVYQMDSEVATTSDGHKYLSHPQTAIYPRPTKKIKGIKYNTKSNSLTLDGVNWKKGSLAISGMNRDFTIKVKGKNTLAEIFYTNANGTTLTITGGGTLTLKTDYADNWSYTNGIYVSGGKVKVSSSVNANITVNDTSEWAQYHTPRAMEAIYYSQKTQKTLITLGGKVGTGTKVTTEKGTGELSAFGKSGSSNYYDVWGKFCKKGDSYYILDYESLGYDSATESSKYRINAYRVPPKSIPKWSSAVLYRDTVVAGGVGSPVATIASDTSYDIPTGYTQVTLPFVRSYVNGKSMKQKATSKFKGSYDKDNRKFVKESGSEQKVVFLNADTVTAANLAAAAKTRGFAVKNVQVVVIGESATKISKGAFKGFKSLSNINLRSRGLKGKGSVKGMLSGCNHKGSFALILPKQEKKTYKKLFTKKNLGASSKIKLTTVYVDYSEQQ